MLLAAAVTLSQVFGFVIPYLSFRNGVHGPTTDGESGAQLLAGTLPAQVITNTTAAFPVFAGALALVLGALVAGDEFTGGTVKTLLTQGPRRASVFGGQLLSLVIAVGVGVLCSSSPVRRAPSASHWSRARPSSGHRSATSLRASGQGGR